MSCVIVLGVGDTSIGSDWALKVRILETIGVAWRWVLVRWLM